MPSMFGGQPITGEEYLKTLPAARQAMVRELLVGKMKYPSLSRNNVWARQLLNDAAIVDPNFDQNTYKVRSDMYHDFTTGKTANLIQALNQAPLHALTLSHAYDQLHNLPMGGETLNNILTQTEAAIGVPSQQAALGQFKASQPAVADELATLYKGSAGTIPGIEAQEKAFPMGAAPTTSNNALATAAELMKDRMDTIENRWKNGMGPVAAMFPVISPKARAALGELYGKYHPQTQSQTQATTSPPSGGPKVGAIQQGYRFNGGDPADPHNWSKSP